MNYLCVDFGGTKTLVCVISSDGNITSEVRFETPKEYTDFLDTLAATITDLPEKFETGVLSVPGLIDIPTRTVIALGNRPWANFKIQDDLLEKTGVKFEILNDSRLAGLAEAAYIKDRFHKVLYITISTGIGVALAVDGKLVPELNDTEFGKIPVQHDGGMIPWEEIASGRAIVTKYNKRASDIPAEDEVTWREVANKIVLGVGPACAAFQPDAIVFGGGVGEQSDKFSKYIAEELKKVLHPVVRQPKALIQSHYKDRSVIYGCYELAKSRAEKQNAEHSS